MKRYVAVGSPADYGKDDCRKTESTGVWSYAPYAPDRNLMDHFIKVFSWETIS